MRNFGANVAFSPRHCYAPRGEDEVLEILDRHARGQVRVLGALHSWSACAAVQDVALDLHHLDAVSVRRGPSGPRAEIGAGARIGSVLRTLHRAGLTLPTIGATTVQSFGGTIATATHGSGMPSMSHYVERLRVAAYDPHSARARIYDWEEGLELRAARCALGLMGVVLSAEVRCVPDYYVEELLTRRESLEEVLALERAYPLQQFVLLPYLWCYYAFQRRALEAPLRVRSGRYLYRAFKLIGVDVLYHLLLEVLLLRGDPRAIVRFYRHRVPHLLVSGRRVVDRSDHALTLQHQLFQHVELEVFIPAHHLAAAVALIRELISVFAGEQEDLSPSAAAEFARAGVGDLSQYRGTYVHHYPISFRRVLPDDTLISMTAGTAEPYYATSFFTYRRERKRAGYYAFAAMLARVLTRLYGARLHWGKHFPLDYQEVGHLYPDLPAFRTLCQRVDPNGVFRNAFARRVLGFDRLEY
jgi:FAD/FMN-containing dehydrogenase